jgi:hypothetical protein
MNLENSDPSGSRPEFSPFNAKPLYFPVFSRRRPFSRRFSRFFPVFPALAWSFPGCQARRN